MTFVLVFLLQDIYGQEANHTDDSVTLGKNFKVSPTPKTNLYLGGAIWTRVAATGYPQSANANRKGFYFDQLRFTVSGDHGIAGEAKLTFSAQVRFWYYMTLVHHMWMGVKFNDFHEIEVGVTQVPFGTLPGSTNSFWYSAGYYVGLEDDRDAGAKYHFTKNGWDLYLAYFYNAEFNDATALNRFAPDLVRSGDQQNEERHQGNIRIARIFNEGSTNTSEVGLSGEIGGIANRTNGENGYRWKGAIHYVGNYGKWSPKAQLARYSYDPSNPVGIDNRLVLMGFFEDERLVAAKGNMVNVSLKRNFDVDWWLFKDFSVYVDYSKIFKDIDAFADTELINPGAVLQAGPFYIWLDWMWAKNSWWFNDSPTNSGPGEGSINPDKYEFRYNLSLEWFF